MKGIVAAIRIGRIDLAIAWLPYIARLEALRECGVYETEFLPTRSDRRDVA